MCEMSNDVTVNQEQMSPAEEISKMLAEKGVRIQDLKEYQPIRDNFNSTSDIIRDLRKNYWKAIEIIKNQLWRKLVEEMGEDEAVRWVEQNVEEEWREKFGLTAKKYKVVEVSTTFKVVMPVEDDDYMWDNYVDLTYVEPDWDVDCVDDDLTAEEAERHNTINTVEDLDD